MIYAVFFFEAYESHTPVRAFTEEKDAIAFKAKLEEYERTKPVYHATPEGIQLTQDWRNNHPAGPYYSEPDRWDIVPIPFNDEQQVRLDSTPWSK